MRAGSNKYFVTNSDLEQVEVTGYPVELAGFEEFDFFLHEDIVLPGFWQVSEYSTGCSVCTNAYPSMQQAIKQAIGRLNEKGKELLREALDERHDEIAEHRSFMMLERV